ncbi:sensory protein TspO [Echinicola pacifica]|uniref:Sensory protein TspO n=1 Tax=Echinicola pacifica TaxID=346377 RepID=A0A918Q9I1_9BACT|nr:TspO/MBR family protein [Echinicola pacifica]GGZ35577.1 sensory protein TspO [Echinicola pacifica]
METILGVQKEKINWIHLILCIAGIVIIGSISGIANIGNIETWYSTLEKPGFNPPNNLFGPVWTILYGLMGLSLYLIWVSPAGKERRDALKVFFIQLVFNFCWSFIFFYFHLIGLAAIEILILWGMIIYMIRSFAAINKWAAYLQVPYLAWVSFASILNISIWWLNA